MIGLVHSYLGLHSDDDNDPIGYDSLNRIGQSLD